MQSVVKYLNNLILSEGLVGPEELGLREQSREGLQLENRELDGLLGGIPRGSLTEINGEASSGRASLLYRILAAATRRMEICALVDVNNSFDPASAAIAGVGLEQLLWVRCGGELETALKAMDLLLHAGGFGVVAVDMVGITEEPRIESSLWYRFRRAVLNSPSVALIVSPRPISATSSSLRLQLSNREQEWTGNPGFRLLRGFAREARSVRPMRRFPALFDCQIDRSGEGVRAGERHSMEKP